MFTKYDRVLTATLERNDVVVRSLVRQGIVQNFLYVSAKTNLAVDTLEAAIFDCNVKGLGGLIEPSNEMSPVKKKKTKAAIKEQMLAQQPLPMAQPSMMSKTGFGFAPKPKKDILGSFNISGSALEEEEKQAEREDDLNNSL